MAAIAGIQPRSGLTKHVTESTFLGYNSNGKQAIARSDLIVMKKIDGVWKKGDTIRRYFILKNMDEPRKMTVNEFLRFRMTSSKPGSAIQNGKKFKAEKKIPSNLPSKVLDLHSNIRSFSDDDEEVEENFENQIYGSAAVKLDAVPFLCHAELVPPSSDSTCGICERPGHLSRDARGCRDHFHQRRYFSSLPECCARCQRLSPAEWICQELCSECYIMLCPDCAVQPGSHTH